MDQKNEIDKIKKEYEKVIAEIEHSIKEDILNNPSLKIKRDELKKTYEEI